MASFPDFGIMDNISKKRSDTMWRDLLLGLLATVLTGVGTWALKTLIPYLNSLVDEKKKDAIFNAVWSAVRAAEQMFPDSKGIAKFNYVSEFIKDMHEIDEDQLRVLIEQAVYNMRLEAQGGE